MVDDLRPDRTLSRWYVLQTLPRMEVGVAERLLRAGIEAFVPQLMVQAQSHKRTTHEPLFPGYLFGRFDPQSGDVRLVRYTKGVSRIVGFGDAPCSVPDELIQSIKRRLASGWGRRDRADCRPGDRVVVTSGPLQGIEAIFDRQLSASGRVRVLIQLLHGSSAVDLHAGLLRRVG